MSLVIRGGKPLEGRVVVGGAKNAALPIIAATLLTADECLLENVPDIEDIRNMVRVLHSMGVAARFEGQGRLRIRAARINRANLPIDLARAMRASFLTVGPLLSRFGQAEAPHPGGCAIGTRPVSVDLKAFQEMGSTVGIDGDYYDIRTPRLKGRRLVLDYPSHTGTENVLMAACLAEGTTIIENSSIEPEVEDLADFLNAMGARVYGAGTHTIRVDGANRLHGTVYRVMPDRMEAGTFALAAMITRGSVTMDSRVARWLGALNAKLETAGAEISIADGRYTVKAPPQMRPTDIQTYPYPGFPTDLQAPYTTTMTQADGISSVHETMFDNRLGYAAELAKMGARIDVSGSGRTAMVHGPTPLHGAQVQALDIRSGAAVVLAGLAAEGETEIRNLAIIERGYENMAAKLQELGADIQERTEGRQASPENVLGEPLEWGTVPYSVTAG
ncbi:MAG: UDP-N-acetylglucosamine 1-carboxyvinyltransferase [Anaerolineae bacterium]|jgi:UDP-N-acetylglucosamine 1-carboxyvinyltransferase